MAPHKEYQYFIIQLGSKVTRVQFDAVAALHDVLPSKTITIPTKVYQHSNGKPNYFSATSSTTDDSDEVKFIENGIITNHEAFNYFVKLLFKSILKYSIEDNTQQFFQTLSFNINLVIVTSSAVFDNFSKTNLQSSINYFYENLDHLNSVSVLSNSLSLLFAYGSNNVSTALVVDVGHDKLSIQPIIDYLPLSYAGLTLPVGANSINKRLQTLLPQLLPWQIEDLKKSEIYEVLAESNKTSQNTDLDEDEIDVLKIVNSNQPKELLLEREKHEKANKGKSGNGKDLSSSSKKSANKHNHELEYNSFIDSQGNEHTIGKQRFLGAEELIDNIDYYINYTISKYPELHKRQELWSNIIINGEITSIKGFKEYLTELLRKNYLITNEDPNNPDGNPEAKFRATTAIGNDPSMIFAQAPTNIKLLKKLEYFQEWKDSDQQQFNDLTILGALIFVRLSFGPGSHHNAISNIGNELYVIKKGEFEENGPNLIWDLNH